MSRAKFRTPNWVNFSLLALLLTSSGVTLTACQNVRFGPQSTKQKKEDKPVKTDKKSPKNQSTKSKSKKSDQKPAENQDTQVDDDPE
jgi:hypothetical protein